MHGVLRAVCSKDHDSKKFKHDFPKMLKSYLATGVPSTYKRQNASNMNIKGVRAQQERRRMNGELPKYSAGLVPFPELQEWYLRHRIL